MKKTSGLVGTPMQGQSCRCGSGGQLLSCCLPVIQGAVLAADAEQLMRSRYTAFVLGDAAYLMASWHPETRPESITFARGRIWLGLEVLGSGRDDGRPDEAWVRFRVRFAENGTLSGFEERSRFRLVAGRWCYLDGESSTLAEVPWPTPRRNDPCPCGSGRKYKKCCLPGLTRQ